MSKFYEETMQSLLQAVEISKGSIPVVQVDGMPAKTYRAFVGNAHETVTTKKNVCRKPFEETSLA